MRKLIYCEFLKLRRKPLVFASSLLSALLPLAFTFLFSSAQTSEEAVEDIMSTMFQLSANLLLMPVIVVLASNLLFEEQDNDTLKNLLAVPISKTRLAAAKMLVLLLFSVLFMAVGSLISLAVVILQGWEPAGFWPLFFIGIGESFMMWVGALPCILLIVAFNKSYIISVIITFFYTIFNYLMTLSDTFIMQPLGLNPGTLLMGPLSFRWYFQFLSHSESDEMIALLERISPYFVSTAQAFSAVSIEAVIFLTLIAIVYKRQD